MSRTARVAQRLATAVGLASLAVTSLGDLAFQAVSPSRNGLAVPAGPAYGRLPLTFEQNTGRYDPSVQFLTRTRGATIFLTSTEAVIVLRGKPRGKGQEAMGIALSSPAPFGGRGSGGGGIASRSSLRAEVRGIALPVPAGLPNDRPPSPVPPPAAGGGGTTRSRAWAVRPHPSSLIPHPFPTFSA